MTNPNLQKTELENFIDLINLCSQVTFTQQHIQLSIPQGLAVIEGRFENTYITITATPQSPIQGDKLVKYRRIDLSTDFGSIQSTFTYPTGTPASTIVNDVKNLYGILPDSNILSESITQNRFKIKADPLSLIYTGEKELYINYV